MAILIFMCLSKSEINYLGYELKGYSFLDQKK